MVCYRPKNIFVKGSKNAKYKRYFYLLLGGGGNEPGNEYKRNIKLRAIGMGYLKIVYYKIRLFQEWMGAELVWTKYKKYQPDKRC